MKNKHLLAFYIIIISVLLISCSNKDMAQNTYDKDSKLDDENSKKIMIEFEKYKDKELNELALFIDANISLIKKSEADSLLNHLIKRSSSDVLYANSESIDNKLKPIFGINFGPHAVDNGVEYGISLIGPKKDLAINNISKASDKEYIKNIFTKGQTINQDAGEYFLIVDYNYLNDKYAAEVSESLAEYLNVMDKETITPLMKDDYLSVSLAELKLRLNDYENFLINHKDSPHYEEIYTLYSTGLYRLLSTKTYFNDFTKDYKLKGKREEYYKSYIDLDSSTITSKAVKELWDFFNSDKNNLAIDKLNNKEIIQKKEDETYSRALLELKK